jgi:tetratricopeptide (TPR) repeat protein
MGNVYFGKKDYDKAIEYYEKYADLFLDFADTYDNVKFAYAGLEIKPNYAQAFYNMGVAYEVKGNKVRARECKEKARGLGKYRRLA